MELVRVVRVAGGEYRVRLSSGGRSRWVSVEDARGAVRRFEVERTGTRGVLLDGVPVEATVSGDRGDERTLHVSGEAWRVDVLTEAEAALAERGTGSRGGSGRASVRAPMPGRVLVVEAREGRPVRRGEALFIIEAMKMENEVRAPADGVVRGLRVAAGDAVEGDQPLCDLVAGGGAGAPLSERER
ncbi:MAG: biotin/lipoyl-containing protein [Gemmatimonadota bacterium]